MKTKELVEGILYMNPTLELLFRAAHITNNEDRNWKPVEHNEIGFIHKFTAPKFVVIVETQIHVFIFGDPYTDEFGNERGFHVYIIEGPNCKHTAVDKKKLIDEVKLLTSQERFLPEGYMNRIIYMDAHGLLYIFNKSDGKSNFFSKSTWTYGTDIYKVEPNNQEPMSAEKILKECYTQVEDYYRTE